MQDDMEFMPYFQPILSVKDSSIYGYEGLGRYGQNGKIQSIARLLERKDLSTPEKLEIDRKVRRQALKRFKNAPAGTKLFININPAWIAYYPGPDEPLPTLTYISELGLKGSDIVIEITEHDIEGDISRLDAHIQRYKEAGCRIAIDDFSFYHLERLMHIMPDLVKIDIKLLRESIKRQDYNKLVNYIARFSNELGVEVLFEGIENKIELNNAISNGGAYLQGFLFSEALPDFSDKNLKQQMGLIGEVLKSSLYESTQRRTAILETELELNLFIRRLTDTRNFQTVSHPDDSLKFLQRYLPDRCIRAFICDSEGTQVSSNLRTDDNKQFRYESEYIGKNWAWRPYFAMNVAKMKFTKQGSMSVLYVDNETRREVRTFSFPLNNGQYLFLDLEDK